MDKLDPKPNKILQGIRGAHPVEIGGKTLTLACKWCTGPINDLTKDSCETCHELLLLMQRRPAAAVAIIGAHMNVAATIVDVIESMEVLPEGFPEGTYEAFDLENKETALEVFRQFGKNVRDSIVMHVIHKMIEMRLGRMKEDTPGPKIVVGG